MVVGEVSGIGLKEAWPLLRLFGGMSEPTPNHL